MTVDRNGTATSSILRLGSLVPERLPVQFEHEVLRDGELVAEDVVLQGYVYGPRCPGLVKAECAAAEEKRRAVFADPAATGADREVAWINFLRSYIVALVPGISFGDADMLAGGQTAAIMLLRGLSAIVDATPGTEAESDGETEAAPPLTTASSSPISSEPSGLTTT